MKTIEEYQETINATEETLSEKRHQSDAILLELRHHNMQVFSSADSPDLSSIAEGGYQSKQMPDIIDWTSVPLNSKAELFQMNQ